MIVTAARASAILHDLLVSAPERRPWILPANVCPIVPVTFLAAGRPFVLQDIDPTTLELDPGSTLARLRAAPEPFGGVLFVRPYGAERDVTPFFAALTAAQPDLLVVDDRCLCRPCPDARPTPGAHLSLFSTGRAKPLDLGGGGFARLAADVPLRPTVGTFDARTLAEVELRCRHAIASGRRYAGPIAGWLDRSGAPWPWEAYRERIDSQLAAADVHRERLIAIYRATIPAAVQLAAVHQSWRFNVRVPQPERLVARLFGAGLFASRHYAPLDRAFGGEPAPVAAALHAEVVNLFIDRNYDAPRAERTAAIVREHVTSGG